MKSLYWRISLSFFVVLLIVGFSYIFITATTAQRYFQETTQRLNASVADYLIKEVNPFQDGKVNEEALGIIMHSMMAVNPGIEVYLLDPDGEIISFVVLDQKVKLKRVELEPIQKFISEGGNNFILGDDPRNPGQESVFSATSVFEDNQLLGYVYITLASEKYETIASSLLGSFWMQLTFNSILITLVVAFLIGLVLISWLTRHLREIVRTVEKFKDGDLKARVSESNSKSELAVLGNTFNHMADTILNNIEELKKVDSLRRELIANVSHDLRNPLAIINGYIETLQIKGENLSKEEKEKYLKIISDSTDRLTKLVADLFDLSKLESGQMHVKLERLKVQELLFDSALKYELLAQTKGIEIKSQICQNLPIVKADLSLIDRVIQNLLDNAVKYTPNQGEILIDACEVPNGGVCIKIRNSGNGIPQGELQSLFDRYYMIDKNQQGVQGSGLGLAIVKHILEIHGSEIKIHSDSKSFTEFEFELAN
ncbi:MAG: HAMP domain-containing sensor histidine kinase [Algoriphagus sp.]|uniref:sensor histidine kinase n=1 Tax=Algoriphagus sp. TaxID=1872435 RepID=UPI002637082A|nr:HAMP domain-containing sensor histidine kinase [Algoriphagus sp.]MDG1276095.1 HAMP domain-containing sensor histidine kinase [Algoriphagus sp.]